MSLRILFTCGRELNYPRNTIIWHALARHFEVTTVTDSNSSMPIRYLRVVGKLISASRNGIDLLFVGFLGQPLMLLAKHLTGKPILFDAFLSVYDTLCFDRKLYDPRSPVGRLAYWLDKTSCNNADHIILDTKAHCRYFFNTFGIPHEKLSALFVGCDENIFYPRPSQNTTPLVLYYGSYLPLQGIDVIVRAAKLLENISGVRFRIIGEGIESARIRYIVKELAIQNIDFLPPVPLERLPDHISQAMVCLGGHFGASEKASRVIAGKTFQCIAMGKPTIVGDNPANGELLTHGFDAWFCPMNDPQSLADSILRLIDDPHLRDELGNNAHQTFIQQASIQVISLQLRDLIEQLSKKK